MDEARVIPLRSRVRPGAAVAAALGRADVVPLRRAMAPSATSADADDPVWQQRVADALAFLRRRVTGDYHVDDFGFDVDLTEQVILPALMPLYQHWFRVEVNGLENVPAEGGALLVANHSGGLWPLDAAMTAVAVHTEHPSGRFLRMLASELLFGVPGAGALARKSGATLACEADAERLLRAGELVATWPEGIAGIGKPFRERYTVRPFRKRAFVDAAVRTGVPIVPVSIVGAEEVHPVLGRARLLARLLDLPYFPLTPTFPWLGPLGLVPLPSKWYIEFGAPIETTDRGGEADDPRALVDLTDELRDAIHAALYRLLVQRRSVWR